MSDLVLDERYQVLEEVARGANGVIHLAKDLESGQTIALKILNQQSSENEEFVARFEREAQVLYTLNHDNAVRVYAVGVTPDKRPYVVMEYVDGQNLSDIVHAEGPLDPPRVANLLDQVADVLDKAHELGVVHRDLKPGNIMVTQQNGREIAKVLDFGFAKILSNDGGQAEVLTQQGVAIGTPAFMSPEQAMGRSVDHRCDLYSLGITLFAILTGRLPFEEKNHLQTMLAHVKQKVPRFSDRNQDNQVPENVEWVVRKALEKAPEDRPITASELARMFGEAAGRPASAPEAMPERGQYTPPPKSFQDGQAGQTGEMSSMQIAILGFIVFAVVVVIAIAWSNM